MTNPGPFDGPVDDPVDAPGDAVVARRLARLGALPVDTSSLEQRLRKQLPRAPQQRRRRAWWVSMSAAAAALLLLAAISLSLLQGRAAQASSMQMAQMHQDIIAGRIPTMHAGSIEDANRAIAAMAGNFPTLPTPPEAQTMACCMRNVGKKKVACVLLDSGSTPVTMVVASAADVESPRSEVTMRGGVAYHVQTVGDLHMVMMERDGRWICFVGGLPAERLMDLAAGVRF
jgi:hypothetical protein